MTDVNYTPDFDHVDVDGDYGSTGGDITVPTFHDIKPFRFWCQKALPLVYDDSLSYYEVLCKVVSYLNNMMTDLTTGTGAITQFANQFVINQQFLNDMAEQLGENTEELEDYINDRMGDFTDAYNELQDYVNEYFNNLDVQGEIDTKLDEMAENGQFNVLFDPVIQAWMEEETEYINTSITNQNSTLAQQNGRISVLEGRMDTFASLPSGSTSGNAELLDIRTNFLGETFGTAGDAVRTSDLVASGYTPLAITSYMYDGQPSGIGWFDVTKYKGGRIAFIANIAYNSIIWSQYNGLLLKVSDTNTSEYDGHTLSPDSESEYYYENFIDELYEKPLAVYRHQEDAEMYDSSRVLCIFKLKENFPYKYIGVNFSNESDISTPLVPIIRPDLISYGTYWLETPIDPTLSVTGEAADAKATGDAISELNERITLLLDTEPTKNLFDKNTMADGIYINESGNVVSSDLYITSDYIYCPNVNMAISSTGLVERQYKYRVAVYDNTKTWMRRVLGPNDTLILDGVNNCYIRISFEVARKTDFDTVQVEVGNTVTSYVPHRMTLDYNGRKLISESQSQINDIEQNVYYSEDFESITFHDGYYAAYYSNIDAISYTENASLSYSDPIPVAPNSAIRLQNIWKAGYCYCLWLDYEQNYIGKAEASTTGSETSSVRVDAPFNAYYAVVNISTAHKDIFNISYYSELTDFVKSNINEKIINTFNHIGNSFESIKNQSIFSLCDDDTTSLELVQIYHDICDDYNVKGCYAAITFRMDEDVNLANALLQYEEEGYGVYFHCDRQIDAYNPSQFDEAVAEANFVTGMRKYKNFGFLNPDIWLIPFGGATAAIISMARRHGIKYLVDGMKTIQPYAYHVTDKFYNYPSKYLNHYNILRRELPTQDRGNMTIAGMKSAIDDCAANGGWIIITTHVNEWYEKDENNNYIRDGQGNLIPIETDGATGESRLREIIQYCQAKGLQNKAIAEGLSIYDAVYNWSESI